MKTNERRFWKMVVVSIWTIAVFVKGALAQDLVWEETNGPDKDWVMSLLALPDRTILAGTMSGGVRRSADQGETWIPTANLSGPLEIRALTRNDTRIFAATSSGVFHSSDGGNTWAQASGPVGLIGSLAHSGTTTLAGSLVGGGIYRSSDNGNSWVPSNSGLANKSIQSLAVIGTTFFAGTNRGIYRSEDDGITWTLSGLSEYNVQPLAIIGSTLFVASEGGYFRSQDGGNTWIPMQGTPGIRTLVVMGTTLFGGGIDGVFRSVDGGNVWTPQNMWLTDTRVHSLVVSGTTLYAGTTGGKVFRSAIPPPLPEEIFWEPVSGSFGQYILAFLEAPDGTLLVGTTDKGILRSTDGGATWVSANNGLGGAGRKIVSGFAVLGTTLFAGTTGEGVYRSTDGGDSWTLVGVGQIWSVHELVALGAVLFAGTSESGVYRSIDGGITWTQQSNGLTSLDIRALTVSGTSVFAGSPYGDGGIFRSDDGGNTWKSASNGLTNDSVWSLTTLDGALFAGTQGGVFRSTDNGNTWVPVNNGLTSHWISSFAVWGLTLFAGTYDGGIFRSDDAGHMWMPVNVGLTDFSVYALGATETSIFAGTAKQGVFRSFLVPPAEPQLRIFSPSPNTVLLYGTTQTELVVNLRIPETAGDLRWHWQLNAPFPTSGPAGGNAVPTGNAATIAGFQDGKTYTVYVTLTDANDAVLSPPVTASVTFSVAQTPLTHRYDYLLPAGLSLFSPVLRPLVLRNAQRSIDTRPDGGVLMASHLVQFGATIVVGMTEGRLQPVVGRNGVLLFGQDFPIRADKGYVINLLSPIALTMEGIPDAIPIPSAPSAGAEPVWVFAVAGEVAESGTLPQGTSLRVRNPRTGQSLDTPIREDGHFAVAFADTGKKEVVAEGDLLCFELVTPGGYVLESRNERRLTADDLRQAFTAVRLDSRPERSKLLPNYPNPFNPETWIPFALKESAEVTIRIYDMQGARVRELDLGRLSPGYYAERASAAYWNGRNAMGESVGSGVYIVELRAGSDVDFRRVVLWK